VTSQFIIAGNIPDVHLTSEPTGTSVHVLTPAQVIVDLLIDRRYGLVYSCDPLDGILLEPHRAEVDPESFLSPTHLGRATASTTGPLADLIKSARTWPPSGFPVE
jgi:hypothetical protein